MTRFKEQRRIDEAIKHGNAKELQWAKSYCKSRVDTANKMHIKRWKNQLAVIETALKDIGQAD